LAHPRQGALTSGVVRVTATGPTLLAARAKAYDNVSRIRFEGAHYRRDIALLEE
jgi:phosphoribosylamine---glycine ligase